MIKYLVVTHEGPCLVGSATYQLIHNRKRKDPDFASQILLAIKMNDFENLDVEILNDKLPVAEIFDDFERLYIMKDPPARRNIII